MSLTLNLFTYNMHLFGDLGDIADIKDWWNRLQGGNAIDLTWYDQDRKDALIAYVQKMNPAPNLIAFQEVWYKDYVEKIKGDLTDQKKGNTYPNSYDRADPDSGTITHSWQKIINESGLLIMSNGQFTPIHTYHFGYINGLGKVPDDSNPPNMVDPSWDDQDTEPGTNKGYRGWLLQFELDGAAANLLFFTTHMPTNAHKCPTKYAVRACFQQLANDIQGYRQTFRDAPVLLMGDFNMSDQSPASSPAEGCTKTEDLYSAWIQNSTGTAILQEAGLVDGWRSVYPTQSGSCGMSVSDTNNFWQHFNPGKIGESRIDYHMFADSINGSVKWDLSSLKMQVVNGEASACDPSYTSGNARPVVSEGSSSIDLSDHFPLWSQVNLLRSTGS